MMKAVIEKKQRDEQHQQMRSRINQLNREKERVMKRIRDINQKQKFVSEINDFKKEK
jgi:hypothetical protein